MLMRFEREPSQELLNKFILHKKKFNLSLI